MFDTTQTVIDTKRTCLIPKRGNELAQDENSDKRFGAKQAESKGLAALAGSAAAARRSVLGDKSNVVSTVMARQGWMLISL
jgi:hypothetical protein